MKRFITIVGIAALLVGFSGCSRYVTWPADVFFQGTCEDQLCACIKNYLRSIRMYDQFSTRGLFDILWLSDQVQEAFVLTRASKKHLMPEQTALLRERERKAFDGYTVVYMFAPLAYDSASSLTHPQSRWSVVLARGDSIIQPYDIINIELGPEYRACIPAHCMRARTAYQVRFAGAPLPAEYMKIIISDATCKASAEWKFDACGAICVPELKRHAAIAYDL